MLVIKLYLEHSKSLWAQKLQTNVITFTMMIISEAVRDLYCKVVFTISNLNVTFTCLFIRYCSKNGLMLLNEIRNESITYEMIGEEKQDKQDTLFTFSTEIDGNKYTGNGKSKKLARNAVSENILRTLYNIHIVPGE